MQIFPTRWLLARKVSAARFAQKGMAYSAPHAAYNVGAKVQRDVRNSKLATLIKNF